MGIFDSYAAYSGLADGSIYEGAYGIDEAEVLEEEAYLEEMESAEVDDDPIEACIEATLVNEQNFNAIMNAVAYDEMKYFVENGVEVVYEEGRISKFFSMIKSAIDKAWAKIKSIFEKVITAITGWISSDKQFVTKYKSQIKSAKNVEYKGYKLKNLDAEIYANLMASFKSLYEDDYNKGKSGKKIDVDKIGDKMRGVSFGDSGKSISSGDYAAELKKFFGLDSDKSTIPYDGTAVLTELETGKANKIRIKNAYNSAKKYFATMKKLLEGEEKASKTEANIKGKTAKSNTYGALSKLCSTGISCCSTAQRMHISALNKYHSQCRAMAAIAVRGKKATKESASMFDFDDDNDQTGDEFGFII